MSTVSLEMRRAWADQLRAENASEAHLDRLRNDFPYFCEHCVFIRTETGELKPLILNRTQRHIWSRVEEQYRKTGKIRVVLCKARQQGSSTLAAALGYWMVTRKRGQ